MSHEGDQTQPDLLLPSSIATKRDVSRLLHELEQIDSALTATEVKAKVGVTAQGLTEMSDQMTSFLAENHLALDDHRVRSQLITRLGHLKDIMPVVHITFASEADNDSLQQLVTWVRQSVHPQAIIAVGLQPDLIGGVYIRTPNRIHDLSVRAQLKDARHLVVEELEAIRAGR